MSLQARERRNLRRVGHHLDPVVTIGDGGVSDGVIAETNRALKDHELIKVRLPAVEREDRRALADALCAACRAELVQSIGRIVLIYRAAAEPDPNKSNVLRHQLAR
ncbi:MAG: ribosome assembly RNA-binding protein YhbY [Gammaproteobacteria bacterium]|nr:MAG: ribosome assembly RNA-binding protein YhbY [Gammaproteobacteria bacterium]